MTKNRNLRLIAPGAVLAVGTGVAIAVGIGHSWTGAIISEIVIVPVAIGYYFLTGSRGDVGAIYGRRSDERQRFVVLRASRLAMILMFASCYVIALVMVATNHNYWQPDVIASAGGVTYFLGLLSYGAHDEDADPARGIMSTDEVLDEEKTSSVIPPM